MGYLNKLIHESQSGFRQKHSCQTALVKLIGHWTACIDKGDIIGTLFVDFRKAFGVVDHSILIKNFTYINSAQTLYDGFSHISVVVSKL